MSFLQASHVIPVRACAQAWNLWEAVQEAKKLMDGLNRYRSHATARSNAGMTYLLRPAPLQWMTCLLGPAKACQKQKKRHPHKGIPLHDHCGGTTGCPKAADYSSRRFLATK